jgi:hypothetical integral membrane protein (TIGR02206 family)
MTSVDTVTGSSGMLGDVNGAGAGANDKAFASFSPTHFGLLALFGVGVAVAVLWGRRHRGGPDELRDRRILAIAIMAVTVPLHIYELVPGEWDLGSSLPFQLCDVAWVLAATALWTRAWWAVGYTYYVGLSIVTQGVITPSLGHSFPDPRFFGFWGMHLLVVWAAVYLTWGLGLRPTWRSYWFTVALTAGWALAAYCFNLVAGTNYGYLNRKPDSASALDVLGPWPWYVVAEIAIVFVGWLVIMTLPWEVRSRRVSQSTAAPR